MTFSDALLLSAIALVLPDPAPVPAPSVITISGPATVIDGDTVIIKTNAGQRVHIRLFGIDAPEIEQRCKDASGNNYNCGLLAADVLTEEIGGAIVVCFPVDMDQYNRTVGVCTARDRDLSRSMVERGWAVDYPRYSNGRYGEAEREAQRERRGLWAGSFVRPQVWRWENRR